MSEWCFGVRFRSLALTGSGRWLLLFWDKWELGLKGLGVLTMEDDGAGDCRRFRCRRHEIAGNKPYEFGRVPVLAEAYLFGIARRLDLRLHRPLEPGRQIRELGL
jgi:hypothetical protein